METVVCVGCGEGCPPALMCSVCDLCPECCKCATYLPVGGPSAEAAVAEHLAVLPECAGCGERFVAAHAEYPVLCVPCGNGLALLFAEQQRVNAGQRTDFPGRCHSDVQCGPWSEEIEREAVMVPELLSRLWDTWRWWFEGGAGESGVAA